MVYTYAMAGYVAIGYSMHSICIYGADIVVDNVLVLLPTGQFWSLTFTVPTGTNGR